MVKILRCAVFIFFSFSATAQTASPEVISSGGGSADASLLFNYSASSRGTSPGMFSAGTTATQGFRQAQDISASVRDEDSTGASSLYPNPSDGTVWIGLDLVQPSVVSVEIFNSLGQVVLVQKCVVAAGSQKIQVDLSSLDNGIYFVQCLATSDDEVSMKQTFKVTLTR
ncbi:MAG TPA: T9SS type A sorting domain-containing protein [Bacteroidia bacterium]|nr:T9SS type A sorting domain-containing protein [Bacteroidia bacterium]